MKANSRHSNTDTFHDGSRLRRRALGNYRYVRMRWRFLFGCVDTLGMLLFSIVRLLSWRPNRNTDGQVSRILLIQFDHLGDAIITTAMFGPLKRRFPNAAIEVLAAPWNRMVFDSVPEVDRVHVCRHNRFAPGRSLLWIPATLLWGLRMRRRRFDLAIDVRGEFPHNLLLWISGARRRLGWGSGGGGFLLTDRPAFVPDRPEVKSRAALLDTIGIHSNERILPTFQPGAAAKETAETAWNELEPVHGQRLRVLLHVGAGTSAKRWPAEHWRRLLDRLTADYHAAVALIGTSNDSPTARAILGACPPANSADWTGRFTVDELAAALQLGDVMVGADSGPAHLAAAVATPVIAIFSGTNSAKQWQPRGTAVRTLRYTVACSPCHRTTCPIAEHPCMRTIQPADVVKTLTKMLSERTTNEGVTAASIRNTRGLYR